MWTFHLLLVFFQDTLASSYIVGRLTGNSELAVNVSVSLQVRLCPCVTAALGWTGTLSRGGYIASCPTAAGTGFRSLATLYSRVINHTAH